MLISCISGSNIKHAKDNSTSLQVCRMIKQMISEKTNDRINVQIIPLVDYEFTPCIGCGRCFKKEECVHDQTFNEVYSKLIRSDGLFVVSAHYSPIPAKLTMLLEKMEQLIFLPRFHDELAHSPLYKKPVGIIGHGGGTEEIIKSYKGVVLNPIANALSWPIEMEIVGINDEWPNGVVFPIKHVRKKEGEIFPVQEFDWEDIRKRINPLVDKVLDKIPQNEKSNFHHN